MDSTTHSQSSNGAKKSIVFKDVADDKTNGMRGERRDSLQSSTLCPSSMMGKVDSVSSSVVWRTVSKLEAYAGDDLADDLLREDAGEEEDEEEEVGAEEVDDAGDQPPSFHAKGSAFFQCGALDFDALTLDWEGDGLADKGGEEETTVLSFEDLLSPEMPCIFTSPRLTTRSTASDESDFSDAVQCNAATGSASPCDAVEEEAPCKIPIPPLGGGYCTGFAFVRRQLRAASRVESARVAEDASDCASIAPPLQPPLAGAAARALLRRRGSGSGSR